LGVALWGVQLQTKKLQTILSTTATYYTKMTTVMAATAVMAATVVMAVTAVMAATVVMAVTAVMEVTEAMEATEATEATTQMMMKMEQVKVTVAVVALLKTLLRHFSTIS
jgi:hypothetical protein